ncbi:F-box protein, partial [Endozoicomonas sp. ONNA2]|uniref:F-box protein n=1 Tax=Endozoicomonas sp. ONNA2 TaxID=2828741 RepID=UPI002147E6B5
MNNEIGNNIGTISPQLPIGTIPSDRPTEEKTAQGISVIPPEQVSPLLALPNELLAKIARYLPFADFRSLDLT